MEELVEQVTVLESRLQVANQVADFLKTSLSQSEDEKQRNTARAQRVELQLEELKKQLEERDNQVADLTFRLSETNRISKFVQISLAETTKENQDNYAKAKDTEDKLFVTEGTLKEMENKVAKTTFRITETDRVLKFVQGALVKTKKDKDDTENKLQDEIARKEFKVTETNRILKFVQQALEKTKEEKTKTENDLERKIASLEFSLSEATRIAKFLQRSATREGPVQQKIRARENIDSRSICNLRLQ